jgi:hypothetical protein
VLSKKNVYSVDGKRPSGILLQLKSHSSIARYKEFVRTPVARARTEKPVTTKGDRELAHYNKREFVQEITE